NVISAQCSECQSEEIQPHRASNSQLRTGTDKGNPTV
ncbi:hypothetical protein SOVF_177660, partial [Spinacia oleracea]